MKQIIIIAASLLLNLPLQAAELNVKPGEKIQDAINRASPGDTILIPPAIYHENLIIDKPNITLRGYVNAGEWPVLDGKNKLNDGIIASGSGFTVEWLHIKL